MANLATFWHWPLSEMDQMSISELMEWHERAKIRSTPDE